jgi:magnesium chelatase family protein
MLRQTLENGTVVISRTQATVKYPASFILVAAMNPCPCGYAGAKTHYCTCTSKQILSYQNRLSGPLRDRFDINLSLKPVDFKLEANEGELSQIVRKRVDEARKRQYDRYGQEICNSRVAFDEILKVSPLTNEQKRTLHQFSAKQNWSNRTQLKIIRLARTISDLQVNVQISDQSIWEAVKLNKKTIVKGRSERVMENIGTRPPLS